MLLKSHTLQTMPPDCSPDATTINAIADLAEDVSEVLPYLASVTKVCTYDDRTKVLMFRHEGKGVVVYPRRIALTKLKDAEEAMRVVDQLKDLINETYENRQRIAPCCKKGGELRVLDVLRLLPGTNCKACGQPTCTAFAARLAQQAATVGVCSPLFGGQFEEKKGKLLALLQQVGYETPG